jgi:hypothetical protein
MSAYAVFQVVVIALVVAWSAAFALRRLLPRVYRSIQASLAKRLVSSTNAFMHKLGERITPHQVASGAGCGSGGGCSSCGTCATTATTSSDIRPLVFHPRAKP